MPVVRNKSKTTKSSTFCRLERAVRSRPVPTLPTSLRALIPVREPSWAGSYIASIFAERLVIKPEVDDNEKLNEYIKSLGWGPHSTILFRRFQLRFFDETQIFHCDRDLLQVIFRFWRLLDVKERNAWKILAKEYRNLYQGIVNGFPSDQGNTFEERIREFRKRSRSANAEARSLEGEYVAQDERN